MIKYPSHRRKSRKRAENAKYGHIAESAERAENAKYGHIAESAERAENAKYGHIAESAERLVRCWRFMEVPQRGWHLDWWICLPGGMAGAGSIRPAGWYERMKRDFSPIACPYRLKRVRRDIFTIPAEKTPTRA